MKLSKAQIMTNRIAAMTDAEYDSLKLESVWVVVDHTTRKPITEPMTHADADATLSSFAENGTVAGWMSTVHIDEAPASDTPTANAETKTVRKVNVRANLQYSPEIKRTDKSGMDSLRDMLKLY